VKIFRFPSELHTPFLIIITTIINMASRDENSSGNASGTPEPSTTSSIRNAFGAYLEVILNAQAPSSASRATRPSSRKDELHLYLAEPPTNLLGALEYWKAREAEWPHSASMAFDFFSILAISSKCERVFSSRGKQTTPESSRLSGSMLWHSECLKNWQRRGAIKMETFKNGIRLALD